MSLMDHQDIVKESLQDFIRSHIPNAQLSMVDDITLSYVASILEDIDCTDDGSFDVGSFYEMMSAYFPEFCTIPESDGVSWIYELSAMLQKINSDNIQNNPFTIPISIVASVPQPRSHTSSESDEQSFMGPRRSPRVSETSDSSSEYGDSFISGANKETDMGSVSFYEDQLSLMQEMFPSACQVEVKHCLTIADGNVEQAAQLMLHRQESGESVTRFTKSVLQSNLQPKPVLNDHALREKIVGRYGFIDMDEDQKEYKPIPPKREPKKLIRYRDSMVVTMKGERFTEVKKEEAETLKKTYVNIKPTKQYRFH